MSSMLSSQGVVLATAMAAVSGTIIILAFRQHKSPPSNRFEPVNVISSDTQLLLRSCISSVAREGKRKKKKVHFAEDVVYPTGNSEEYRKLRKKQQQQLLCNNDSIIITSNKEGVKDSSVLCNNNKGKRMPANRAALYNGILRDRVLHRVTFSF